LLALESQGPLLKLLQLPADKGVTAIVPLYLFLDDPMLPGQLATLQIQLDEGDHDANDDDGKTYPGAYVCPCARAAGRMSCEPNRDADDECECYREDRCALAHGQTRYRLRR